MQAVSSRTSLEEGRALYGLTDSELFWDKASDTKMLLAWSRTCVVCAFRGTASLNNAMSDLQVWPCTWTRVSGAVLAVCKLRWMVGVDSCGQGGCMSACRMRAAVLYLQVSQLAADDDDDDAL